LKPIPAFGANADLGGGLGSGYRLTKISAPPPVNFPVPYFLLSSIVAACGVSLGTLNAADSAPIHRQVDALIIKAAGDLKPASPADDAEFFRRVHLDFAGVIPTAEELAKFLADKAPDKRAKTIDSLLNGPAYAKRMADCFNVHLMERRAENPLWAAWLEKSFAENKPWDRMAREIIRSDFRDEPNRGAAFFMAKRLDKVGQMTTDYPGLTRDVGRLFLGMDLQCAECHNHRLIDDYDQADFQGLFAAFKNLTLLPNAGYPAVEEGVITAKLKFASVFTQKERETAPRVPGREELGIPMLEKGQEYEVMPDKKAKTPGVPKFSPLTAFSNEVPQSPTFSANFVNRVWFFLMGRGLVEPLDQFHSENPASHPEILDLLAREFTAKKYDIKWLLRELSLTDAYQRSSRLPDGVESLPEEKFLVAKQRRLSAEQLVANALRATGANFDEAGVAALRVKFVKALANEPKEPELEFAPSLKSALFVMNDADVQKLASTGPGSIVARLSAEKDDARAVAALFATLFSRAPSDEEKADLTAYLAGKAADRPRALREIAWAMLASTEFAVNH
jgi:hypothetical protein